MKDAFMDGEARLTSMNRDEVFQGSIPIGLAESHRVVHGPELRCGRSLRTSCSAILRMRHGGNVVSDLASLRPEPTLSLVAPCHP